MQITFCGATQTVTGSQHLVEVNGKRILLDCGLYQGKRAESYKRNKNFPFDPASVDVLVLSHAHIDHSGNIPNLVKNGFRGDIICTFATRDLCSVMLRDSGFIHERDAEYINKKHKRTGELPVDPLYTEEEAIQSLAFFLAIGYERRYAITPDIAVTFYDAGHMLGSAIVALDITDHEVGADRRLVFSGDIGRPEIPILRDPVLLDEADVLIMESTYGGRMHPPIEESEHEMEEAIVRAYRRGGKVIIPAFAVGRTQQIVYTLNKAFHNRDIPEIQVFVDSPLAVNATDIFRLHPEAYDKEALNYLTREDPDGDIFGFSRLRYVRQVEQSKEINYLKDPAVIISASGMMEHGRVLHHLKNNIEDSRNIIIVAGWQAPDTLGRRIVEHQSPVRIFGDEYQLKAEVLVLNGFSGHADHQGLVQWANAFTRRRPGKVFLVHGELDAAQALARSLRDEAGYQDVYIPTLNETFRI
nr:MBL fold metallo-hydrolase [Anaerolineae bacterium]